MTCHRWVEWPLKPPSDEFRSIFIGFLGKLSKMTLLVAILSSRYIGERCLWLYQIRIQKTRKPPNNEYVFFIFEKTPEDDVYSRYPGHQGHRWLFPMSYSCLVTSKTPEWKNWAHIRPSQLWKCIFFLNRCFFQKYVIKWDPSYCKISTSCRPVIEIRLLFIKLLRILSERFYNWHCI